MSSSSSTVPQAINNQNHKKMSSLEEASIRHKPWSSSKLPLTIKVKPAPVGSRNVPTSFSTTITKCQQQCSSTSPHRYSNRHNVNKKSSSSAFPLLPLPLRLGEDPIIATQECSDGGDNDDDVMVGDDTTQQQQIATPKSKLVYVCPCRPCFTNRLNIWEQCYHALKFVRDERDRSKSTTTTTTVVGSPATTAAATRPSFISTTSVFDNIPRHNRAVFGASGGSLGLFTTYKRLRQHWKDLEDTTDINRECPFVSCSVQFHNQHNDTCRRDNHQHSHFEEHMMSFHYDNIAYLSTPYFGTPQSKVSVGSSVRITSSSPLPTSGNIRKPHPHQHLLRRSATSKTTPMAKREIVLTSSLLYNKDMFSTVRLPGCDNPGDVRPFEVKLATLPKFTTLLGHDFLFPHSTQSQHNGALVEHHLEEEERVQNLQKFFSFLHSNLTFMYRHPMIMIDPLDDEKTIIKHVFTLHPSVEARDKFKLTTIQEERYWLQARQQMLVERQQLRDEQRRLQKRLEEVKNLQPQQPI